METIGDRISQVIERLGISARELSRRSDLTEPHVSIVITRYRKNPKAHVELETLSAIARGAGVSLNWLITGKGSPNDQDATPGDDVPTVQHSDDETPVAENIPGWAEVEKMDRADPANADLEEQHWAQGRKGAHFWIHGPAAPGDAAYLARMAKRFGSEERLHAAVLERDRRIKELEAKLAALKAAEDEALAKKAAKVTKGKKGA